MLLGILIAIASVYRIALNRTENLESPGTNSSRYASSSSFLRKPYSYIRGDSKHSWRRWAPDAKGRKEIFCFAKRERLKMCTSGNCNKADSAERARCALQFLSGSISIEFEDSECLGFCGEGPNFKRNFPPKTFLGQKSAQDFEQVLCGLGEFNGDFHSGLSAIRKGIVEEQDQGLRAIMMRHPNHAIEHLTKALDNLDSQNADGWDVPLDIVSEFKSRLFSARAEAYLASKEKKMSLADANAALDVFPGNAHAWAVKASAHEMSGEQEFAETARDIAVRINPRYFK
eukprot:jgi/Bigna1/126513/aug1.2_g1221